MTEVTERIEQARPRRFRRYPEYKDSGIEWLGEIPMHWRVKRLKFVTHTIAGQSPPSAAVTDGIEGLPFLQGNAEFGPLNPTPHQVCDSAPKRTEPGDILLSVRAPVGAMNIADQPYGIGRGLCAIRPALGIDRSFCFYEIMAVRPLLDAVATGSTYDAVTASNVGDLPMLLPYQGEQRAIAAFLDRETGKIDGLVARKERLIKLLQEKRAALITRAVTRGLDSKAHMKDSRIEWLGEIPAHWEVMPLKRLLSRCDYGISENLGGSGDIRVLTMAHIQQGEVELPDDGSISSVDRTMVLEFGDLLFNRTNSRELVGKVGMFRGNQGDHVTFASYLVRLTAREGVEPEWLNYLLNSSGVLGMARSMALLSVNQANLNPTKYQQIVVPTPVLSEQQTIAGYLRCETASIDSLIAKIRQAIDHLKEFRTALISTAVTGKIDVREEAL